MTTHMCPPDGSGLTPCCEKTPFELPRDDRLTAHQDQVDCGEITSGPIQEPAYEVVSVFCPECAQGKPVNCTGHAYDAQHDELVPCATEGASSG